jgi:hypothetical protein
VIQIAANVMAAAQRLAPLLHLEANSKIDPVTALLAIAHVETSGGVRAMASKHETAYCYGGRYHSIRLRDLSRVWGCCAHSSWGPWQILYITAVEAGFTGDPVLLRDPEVSGPYVVAVMNRRVFDALQGETIIHLFDAWNSGNPRDKIVPTEYIERATEAYIQLERDLA